jgi:hypothetical protein
MPTKTKRTGLFGKPSRRPLNERRPNAERLRQLIQGGMLVARLQKLAKGEIENDADQLNVQVRAGVALLNKVLPDLQRTEVTGKDEGPVEIILRAL